MTIRAFAGIMFLRANKGIVFHVVSELDILVSLTKRHEVTASNRTSIVPGAPLDSRTKDYHPPQHWDCPRISQCTQRWRSTSLSFPPFCREVYRIIRTLMERCWAERHKRGERGKRNRIAEIHDTQNVTHTPFGRGTCNTGWPRTLR
jgi:hypothetical protein